MPIFELIVFGILLPGVVAFAGCTLSLQKRLSKYQPAIISLGAAIALSLSYIILFGLPAFPATEMLHSIYYMSLLAMILAVIHRQLELPTWLSIFFALFASVLSAWMVMNPGNEFLWQDEEPLLWIFIMAHLSFLLWITVPKVYGKAGDKIPGSLLVMSAFSITVVLANSGSLKFLFMGLIICSVLFAAWLATFVFSRFEFPAHLVPFSTVLLLSLLFAGYKYAELPRLSLLLLLFTLFVPKFVKALIGMYQKYEKLIIILGIAAILILASLALMQTFPANAYVTEEQYQELF